MTVTRHPLAAAARLANVPIDEALIARLETGFRRFAAHGDLLAERFYERLRERAPEVRRTLPADDAVPKQRLMETLTAVFGSLRSPEVALARLAELGRYHATLGIRAAHTDAVEFSLLGAVIDVAAAAWTPELESDWSGAVHVVAAALHAEPRPPRA